MSNAIHYTVPSQMIVYILEHVDIEHTHQNRTEQKLSYT